jgi:hypothetical protein
LGDTSISSPISPPLSLSFANCLLLFSSSQYSNTLHAKTPVFDFRPP